MIVVDITIEGEERFPNVGVTDTGRWLVVVLTERGTKARVVTAFEADKDLIAFYIREKKTQYSELQQRSEAEEAEWAVRESGVLTPEFLQAAKRGAAEEGIDRDGTSAGAAIGFVGVPLSSDPTTFKLTD